MAKVPKIKDLKKICYPKESQKKDIYRKIGIYAVRPMLQLGITPNMVTATRAILLLLGLWLYATGTYWQAIGAAVIFEICIFFDTFDGAIARYRKMSSKLGEYMDFILDHVASTVVYFFALGVYTYLNTNELIHVYIAIVSIVVAQIFFLERIIYRTQKINFEKIAKESVFFRFIYQDNNRLYVNILLLGTILNAFVVLNILFAIYGINKLIFVGIFFYKKKNSFIFSIKNIRSIAKIIEI